MTKTKQTNKKTCQEEGRWWEEIIALDLGPVTEWVMGFRRDLGVCSMACHLWVLWASVSPSL